MILEWWTDQAGELGLIELDVNPIMFGTAGAFVADALAVRPRYKPEPTS